MCIRDSYEKKLEFWRKLWRVIESSDLEKYVKEVSPLKQNLILVNKSDLLSPEQRKEWAEYFAKENIKFAFFSAITEDFTASAIVQVLINL